MTKPAILVIDDDPHVRSAVTDDLRAIYARDYRIVVTDSGASGLAAVAELQRRGDDIALFLVDERMPEMTGTQFLLQARELVPDAKKVLLTAYADTDAAIRSINEVGLDHYLLKPWYPPEDSLYPVLDDLLEDWHASRPAAFDGIRIVGARWSAATHDVKDFLARNLVPYRFLDVERDADARRLLAARGEAEPILPLVFFSDGSVLSQPNAHELAGRIGLRSRASAPFYDLVIVGAGPAGLAGAVYGASEGLRVAVLEMQATGGQAGTSSRIENYLGFPNGISGTDLTRRATAQAARLGAEILSPVEVATLRVEGGGRTVVLSDGAELGCHTVLVASGMKVRHLGVPGYERLHGAGVFYGATLAEAASYKGERVIVVGGANSAGQAAMMFSRFAAEVLLLVRGPSIHHRMSRYLVDQVEATAVIRVLTSTQVQGVGGDEHLERVELRHGDGTTSTVEATGLFVFVGAVPHTDFLTGVVAVNPHGFVLTGPDITGDGSRPPGWPLQRDPYLLECSVPGIFAAGDVRHGAVRRVASAVGQGAIAISLVHQHLATA
ncbi:MAG: response regulator [Nitriliruptorales bacterium]|nr:response regulator [Nitriliruptorales bacterium]